MKKENKIRLIKILIIVACIIALILAIYLPLRFSGILSRIDSAEELRELIASGGIYSYTIFFVLQFLQTTILPIPAIITTIAGSLVFGPWITSLLSFVSIMLASIFSFFLGKKIGRKIVVWVAGEETTIKWQTKLEKGKYVFFLMMLFPVFPDDILCLLAGATTTMSWKFFVITNLITRPISIITTCFFGSGYLIPFSGWGIPVWIVLIAIVSILFYLSIKYQSKIENFIEYISNKLSRHKHVECVEAGEDNAKTDDKVNTDNID